MGNNIIIPYHTTYYDRLIEFDMGYKVTHYRNPEPPTREEPGCGEELEYDLFIYHKLKKIFVPVSKRWQFNYADLHYDLILNDLNFD